MIKIRTYYPSDKEEVISLWNQVFHPQVWYNDPEVSIQLKTKQDDGLFFIAEKNQQVIGTILAGFDGHRGWLYSVAVHPQYRQQGIGSQLVKKAIGELKRLGCLKVNLQINMDNHKVVEFYKKNGFLVEERISMGMVLQD